VEVVFTRDGIEEVARLAQEVNERTENIGTRRRAHHHGAPAGRRLF